MSEQDPPQVELDGFYEWKGQRFGGIDPSFTKFLYQDVPARIPIWSVQLGGVVRDGIPPLEFPKTVPGDGVNFLLPDEPGSAWSATDDGLISDDGRWLDRIPARELFWFAWFAFFPGTEVYSGG